MEKVLESRKKPQLWILFFIVAIGTVSGVFFTPGLPAIAKYYQVSYKAAMASVFVFLFGYTFGQLFYGPLANRYGRKRAIYLGMGLQVFGSLLIIVTSFTAIFPLFLLFVFIMSLGGSVGLKISFTIISDVYSQTEARKRIAMLGMSFAIIPAITVSICGFLIEHLDWQSSVVFVSIFGIIVWFLSTFLPETSKVLDPKALHFLTILKGYFSEIKKIEVFLCALLWGGWASLFWSFSALAPYIGIQYLKLNPSTYGLLYLLPNIGVLSGGIVSRFLVERSKVQIILLVGIMIIAFTAVLQSMAFLTNYVNAWTLFMPMPFILFGGYLVFANASSLGMSIATNKSNASAIMNFVNVFISSMSVLILNLIPHTNPAVLPLYYVFISFAMFIVLFALLSYMKKK